MLAKPPRVDRQAGVQISESKSKLLEPTDPSSSCLVLPFKLPETPEGLGLQVSPMGGELKAASLCPESGQCLRD